MSLVVLPLTVRQDLTGPTGPFEAGSQPAALGTADDLALEVPGQGAEHREEARRRRCLVWAVDRHLGRPRPGKKAHLAGRLSGTDEKRLSLTDCLRHADGRVLGRADLKTYRVRRDIPTVAACAPNVGARGASHFSARIPAA